MGVRWSKFRDWVSKPFIKAKESIGEISTRAVTYVKTGETPSPYQVGKQQAEKQFEKARVSEPTTPIYRGRGGGVSGGVSGGGSPTGKIDTGKIDTQFISGGISAFDTGTPTSQKTISQQLAEQKPVGVSGVMTAYDPYNKTYYKQPWMKSAKQSFMNIGGDVKTFFTGRARDKYIGYEKWFSPFAMSGEQKRERVAYTFIPSGSINPKTSPFKKVTYGDIQFGIEQKRLITSSPIIREYQKEMKSHEVELQSQINKEGLKVSEAEKLWKEKRDVLQPTYEKQVSKIYKGYPDVSGLYKQSGSLVPTIITFGIETTSMFHPATAVGMAAHKGKYPQEVIIKSTEKGIPLYPHEKYGYVPATYLMGGLLGAVKMPFKVGEEITSLRLSEGLKAPRVTMSREIYTKGKETFYISRTLQKTPYFEATTKMQYPIFKTKTGFNIGVGSGKTTTRLLPFMEQMGTKGGITSTKSFSLQGSGSPALIKGIKGTLGDITLAKPIKGFKGIGHIVIGDKLKRIRFGGWSENFDKVVLGRGGQISKLRYYPKTGKITGLFKPKDYMIMKKGLGLDLTPKRSEGFKGWTSFQGGGKKSSSAYLQSLYQTKQISQSFGGAVHEVTAKFTSPTIKQFSKTYPLITKYPTKKLISIYAKPELKMDKKQFLTPVIKTSLSPILKPTTRIKSGVIAGLSLGTATIPKTKIKLGSALLQQPKLKTKQIQFFKSMFAPTTITPSTIAPTLTGGWGIPLVIPTLPKLFGAKGKKKKKGKKPTRKTKYVPTIAAQTYGLTASTIPESYYIGAGGLGGRPKIVKKKKTKRRKKR
ncbi:MAG: hypothetical protein ACTSXY_12405 [Promethearchaeota archaeon]